MLINKGKLPSKLLENMDSPMFILHRYFIAADQQKNMHDRHLQKAGHSDQLDIVWYIQMSLWYALLYVVIEGWRENRFHDTKIDHLLQSKNTKLLRRYRNGVFHFQKKYLSSKCMDLIKDGEDVVDWVRSTHSELSRFFLETFREVGYSQENSLQPNTTQTKQLL